MQLKRIESGFYESTDGRVVIRRVISRQTYHPDEVCWCIEIDGKALSMAEETKRDAVKSAEQALKKVSC